LPLNQQGIQTRNAISRITLKLTEQTLRMAKKTLLATFNYGYYPENLLRPSPAAKVTQTMKRSFFAITCCLLLSLSTMAAQAAPVSGIKRLGYAIQMGAFSNTGNAERFTRMLQSKGIEAFYFRKDNGIYAVRFGDFATKDKARKAASRLVAAKLIDSYYIAPPSEIVFKPAVAVNGGKTTKKDNQKPEPVDTKPHANIKPNETKGEQDMGAVAARTAERFVGIPYRWGGNNVVDGMDCSGFVRAVYNLCGVSIPRTSREQFKTGTAVGREKLEDGDLVFFGSSSSKINHVGIYVGNRKFVHAPRRGEDIKVTTLDDSYFEKRFVGARRYFQ